MTDFASGDVTYPPFADRVPLFFTPDCDACYYDWLGRSTQFLIDYGLQGSVHRRRIVSLLFSFSATRPLADAITDGLLSLSNPSDSSDSKNSTASCWSRCLLSHCEAQFTAYQASKAAAQNCASSLFVVGALNSIAHRLRSEAPCSSVSFRCPEKACCCNPKYLAAAIAAEREGACPSLDDLPYSSFFQLRSSHHLGTAYLLQDIAPALFTLDTAPSISSDSSVRSLITLDELSIPDEKDTLIPAPRPLIPQQVLSILGASRQTPTPSSVTSAATASPPTLHFSAGPRPFLRAPPSVFRSPILAVSPLKHTVGASPQESSSSAAGGAPLVIAADPPAPKPRRPALSILIPEAPSPPPIAPFIPPPAITLPRFAQPLSLVPKVSASTSRKRRPSLGSASATNLPSAASLSSDSTAIAVAEWSPSFTVASEDDEYHVGTDSLKRQKQIVASHTAVTAM